jgi:hypothetical protein
MEQLTKADMEKVFFDGFLCKNLTLGDFKNQGSNYII